MKNILLIFLLTLSLFADSPQKKDVHIGIFSFRSEQNNQKIWMPLIKDLNTYVSGYNFIINSYNYVQMAEQVKQNKVDFIIVHPMLFIEMETLYGVTNIASLVRQSTQNGKFLNRYGGVIVTLKESNINGLDDVKGKTIATIDEKSFVVMLIERELLHHRGIDITKDCKIIYTGQPMNKVLDMLREKKADVAFLRTGYIEEKIKEGKIKEDELKVIHKMYDKDYPYIHSTKLYPEWAVAATKHATSKLIKDVTIALYQIHSDKSADYAKFSIPLSYEIVRKLMQKYYLFPYERTNPTFKDIINNIYEVFLVIVFLMLGAFIMMFIYRLQLHKIKKQATEIETILSTASDGIHIHDLEGQLIMCSDSFASMLGYTKDEVMKLTVFDWDTHFQPSVIKSMIKKLTKDGMQFETKHTKKDGTQIDVEINSKIIIIDKQHYIYASSRDISERKLTQLTLLKHKAMFDNIAEGIYAVDRNNICTYINQAGLKLLELDEADIIDKNPHIVFHHHDISGNTYSSDDCKIHEAVLLSTSARLEDFFIKQDGTIFPVYVTVAPVMHDGLQIGSIITFEDITVLKENERLLKDEKEIFYHAAHHDQLTQLPNRLSLIEYMKNIADFERKIAFMFIDLDGFKEVNDSLGHDFGDKLLVRVSELLKKIFPKDTFIYRMGGDEFVVLLDYKDDTKIDIMYHLNILSQELKYPFTIENNDIYITASIGIALYPTDASSLELLLQYSDVAMYNAKRSGKNRFSFFDKQLLDDAILKTQLVSKLKTALDEHEFEIYFQPQVEPYGGKIIGAEVLLRWFRSDGEIISPTLFIPVAEDMGIINDIGKFVLTKSFEHIHNMVLKGLLKTRIAVNISPKQLIHPTFMNDLNDILKKTKCEPKCIELEITEGSILENPDKIIVLLTELRNKGFHLSIDDFGTGYSSMSYLKNLPIDKLKIDQSFIFNVDQEAKNKIIVKSIISLAKGLQLNVLAEGVERKDELDFLKHNGIDSIQGFYYHKPMSYNDFENLLSKSSTSI